MNYSFNDVRTKSFITEAAVEDSFTSIAGFQCQEGFKYSYCPAEGSYFINPQPNLESLDEFYNGHGALLTDAVLEQAYRKYEEIPQIRDLVAATSQYVARYAKQGNWLDFGCGPGLLMQHNRQNFHMVGLEISAVARDFLAQRGFEAVKSLADLSGRQFDVITAIDVIEHVPDPKKFIAELSQYLTPDGIILLRMPVTDGITFERKHPERWKYVYAPYHLHMLSQRAIKLLAGSLGLNVTIFNDPSYHARWEEFRNRFRSTPLNWPMLRYGCYRLYGLFQPLVRRFVSSDAVYVVMTRRAAV
jgi:SAM-dependent methyltransferase